MILRSKVMQSQVTKLCLVAVVTLMMGHADAVCERRITYWDPDLGECLPCTRCNPHHLQIVTVPCEKYRDTICQAITDLNIWPFNVNFVDGAKNDKNSSLDNNGSAGVPIDSDNVGHWDMETWTLIMATSCCVVFFIVVVTLTFYHSRQWKKLKIALQSDVQDLTAKLQLMESGVEPVTERASTDHHIYSNIQVSKDVVLAAAGKHGFGNVYTEE